MKTHDFRKILEKNYQILSSYDGETPIIKFNFGLKGEG
jgi:hypothetical protein